MPSESLFKSDEFECVLFYPDTILQSNPHRNMMLSENMDILIPDQTHSNHVEIVSSSDKDLSDTDAIITFEKNLWIGIRTADCVPIIIYAPDIRAVAAVHAGWRGTIGRIIERAVNLLQNNGQDPKRLQVIFGPSISVDHYEVSEELAEKFRQAGFSKYVVRKLSQNGIEYEKSHIDLQQANIEILNELGIKNHNILPDDECTFSTLNEAGIPKYQSYRRSNGKCGRNITAVRLLDPTS